MDSPPAVHEFQWTRHSVLDPNGIQLLGVDVSGFGFFMDVPDLRLIPGLQPSDGPLARFLGGKGGLPDVAPGHTRGPLLIELDGEVHYRTRRFVFTVRETPNPPEPAL